MPLTEETLTVDEAIEELDEQIDEYADEVEALDSDSERAKGLRSVRNTLKHYRTGLVWQRDTVGWGGDTELTFGPPTAGEDALMDREMPDNPGDKERRLWWVAGGTVDAPYHDDDLVTCFANVGETHPGFVKWAEAKLNGLATPWESETGNRSSSTSSESDNTAASTTEPA